MEYMGAREAAEKWGCSKSTVYKWCKEEKIQFIIKAEKVNGQWRIPTKAECPKKFRRKQTSQ